MKNWLEESAFLDTGVGLEFCGGRQELYKDVLTTYVKKEKLSELEAFYEKKDWGKYRTQVHALKSTSLTIGAVELSEKAAKLELAAAEENPYYIESHHDDVMKEYQLLIEKIADALGIPYGDFDEAEVEYETDAKILVVDDDDINLMLAQEILSEHYSVRTMNSARQALKQLEVEKPELILLDLHMPEIDGFEMMRLLQEKEEWGSIPVVFLTADNDRAVEVRGFKAGAQDFITKPFVPEIMIQRVNRILELSRLQRNLESEVKKQTKKAEARRRKVERLSDQIMKTLAGTIDAKDKYTNGHSLRVAEYAMELARRAGKTKKEQERIYYMALLHDIGKIGIPDYIITKQSGLTDQEYEMTRFHPVIGAEILKNISEIPKLAIGARWHHERYDGKGYPDGLSGEEIPEEARLIAVADAYDAMASIRSYRDVLPQEIVYREIEKGSGTQFDPVYAGLMLEMIKEDTEYNLREKQKEYEREDRG